ncbi:MAG: cysteine desulfurase NifS [Myxococcales bacterium]|nr:cysteine desulfurase NifS [Myxococcales bacterium]
MRRVYLDYNATTPLAPEAAAAMIDALRDLPGNPSSIHREGQRARAAVEQARRRVAELIGADFTEIVLTSGASEANNIAVAALGERGPLLTTAIEHPSVLAPAQRLAEVVRAQPGPHGELPEVPALIAQAEAAGVRGVSVMLANNETGNVLPVAQFARAARERGWWVHCDATQAVGKIPVDVEALGVDLLSLSSHKLYGPKGVGALYVRAGLELPPMIVGGHQERGRRAGTENVAAIVGMGEAARISAQLDLAAEAARQQELREALWAGIQAIEPGAHRQGLTDPALPNTLNVRFPGVDGETLLMNLDLEGIAVSAGSACSAGSLEPSHVILAMGVPYDEARGSVRFSLGRPTTEEEIQLVLKRLPVVLERTRSLAWG